MRCCAMRARSAAPAARCEIDISKLLLRDAQMRSASSNVLRVLYKRTMRTSTHTVRPCVRARARHADSTIIASRVSHASASFGVYY